jgi:hypothetical protein
MTFKLRAFSFGAGVQSTAMMLLIQHDPDLLMGAVGHLPDVAFFADTGAEVQATHEHFDRMARRGFPIPVRCVSNGSILGGSARTGNRSFVPLFTQNPDGSIGKLMRKCTAEFKILPIERGIRAELGLKPRQRWPKEGVALWLGISTDEADRMKPNQNKTITNIYPLIELGWNRRDCLAYCDKHGVRPPKSRCFMCPYIRDWVAYREEAPWDFRRAIDFDASIRQPHAGFKGQAFIHRSCCPLEEAVELIAADRIAKIAGGIPLFDDYDSWSDECFGICGV